MRPTTRTPLAASPPRLACVALAGLMAAALTWLTPLSAWASADVDGRWRRSSQRDELQVQQWLEARCGPPPRSSSTGGGEIVTIRREGDELSFVGGGRVYRTNQCYDPMPTLTRESHSREPSGNAWRTRCVTPPNDPRRVLLNTLVVVTTETHIDLVETGRYETTVDGGRCIADVKRTVSWERVPDEAPLEAATSAPSPSPTPPAPEPSRPAACSEPGAPARLEVRPSKKLARAGESFALRAVVLDARGCDARTPTKWRLADGAADRGVAVDGTGKVTVAPDAPEGTVEIVASAAGKDARVAVEVASSARYEALLARSGLNAAGEDDEAAAVTIASQSLGAGEGRVEDRSRERRLLFMAILAVALLALGVAALFLLRRARRAKDLLERAERHHDARMRDALERRRRREEEHAAQVQAHEASVAAARAPVPPVAPRGKICPTCGERFDGGATFCGKDGTQLVLVN